MRTWLVCFLWLGLGTWARAAVREYPVTARESVRLTVPDGWKETVTNSITKPVVTVRFSPEQGDDFAVLVTFGPNEGTNGVRLAVEAAARNAGISSAERKAEIKKLKGRQVAGYYFSLSDRAPESGWKYLTQGIVEIGDLMAAFTLLSNDAKSKIRIHGLEMVRNAIVLRNSGKSK